MTETTQRLTAVVIIISDNARVSYATGVYS